MQFTDPDCFDLVAKCSTTVDTIERKVLTTTPTTDKSREVIAVIASAAAVTVLIMFFVIIICIQKGQNTKEKTASPGSKLLKDACPEHDNDDYNKTSMLIKSTRLPLKGTTNAAKHYANDLLYTFEPSTSKPFENK